VPMAAVAVVPSSRLLLITRNSVTTRG
jgi:hypothetical protein